MSQADLLYLRSREEMLNYEDTEFAQLIAGVPDTYPALSDNSLWGSLLRALAMELARIEVMFAYDFVSNEVRYLTPPDSRRQLAGVLSVDRNYPQATQYDRDYRDMMTALYAAYQEGVTPQAMSDVIYAYTGQRVKVLELFREIGNGVYDASDRNTVQVEVTIGTSGDGGIIAPDQVQTVTQSLYNALQLATPAHVGVLYVVVFGEAEDVSATILNITDTLDLIYEGEELYAYQPEFTAAPMFNPASPDTELTASGKRVGSFMASLITGSQYAALMSDAFRAEYAQNQDGSYSLLPTAVNDVLLTDANGNPTGAVSKANGVLAPEQVLTWEIISDDLEIFELDA